MLLNLMIFVLQNANIYSRMTEDTISMTLQRQFTPGES